MVELVVVIIALITVICTSLHIRRRYIVQNLAELERLNPVH